MANINNYLAIILNAIIAVIGYARDAVTIDFAGLLESLTALRDSLVVEEEVA